MKKLLLLLFLLVQLSFQHQLFAFTQKNNLLTASSTSSNLKESNKSLITIEERKWIEQHPNVLFTGNPNWLPFEAFLEDGNYIGIVADHLKLIQKRAGLRFNTIPVSSWSESLQLSSTGKVSIISGDSANKVLSSTFSPTTSYSKNPIVIVMDHEHPYVDQLDEIKDKKIVIIKDYGYTADILKYYSGFNFIEVENIQEGLLGVAEGKFDAMLATMALASYHIAELGLHNITVVGKTKVIMNLTLFIDKK